MSSIINERYIEGVDLAFKIAIDKKDWKYAEKCIDDLVEFGFDKEAKILTQELEEAKDKENLLQDSINEDSHDA